MKYLQFSAAWCNPCQSLSPIMEQVKAKEFAAPKKQAEDSPFKDDSSSDDDLSYFSKLAEED